MKKINKVNILGTEYEIISETEEENPKLENTAGLCEYYSKKIILNEFKSNKNTFENIDAYKKKVLRHEIIHAFLAESGLRSNSDWAENEETVDWFSIQFEKILEAFIKVNALENRRFRDEKECYDNKELEDYYMKVSGPIVIYDTSNANGKIYAKNSVQNEDGSKVPLLFCEDSFEVNLENVIGNCTIKKEEDKVYGYCYIDKNSIKGKKIAEMIKLNGTMGFGWLANKIDEDKDIVTKMTIREVWFTTSPSNPKTIVERIEE